MPVLWSVTFSPAPDTKIGMEQISITMLDAAAMSIDDDDEKMMMMKMMMVLQRG